MLVNLSTIEQLQKFQLRLISVNNKLFRDELNSVELQLLISFVRSEQKIVNLHHCAASSLSSLAASEAAAAVGAAIDIDTYFRGSNGFFAPMQNSYPHGKKPKLYINKYSKH